VFDCYIQFHPVGEVLKHEKNNEKPYDFVAFQCFAFHGLCGIKRKYSGKDFGLIIDYIGIRDNMRQALKVYGGDTSIAPTDDDIDQATRISQEPRQKDQRDH
jgi:hypothetical protein